MRTFLILALVAVSTNAASLCTAADEPTHAQVKSIVRTGAMMLIGDSCPSLAGNVDKVLFSGKCANIARESVCFASRAAERYDGVTTVSYGLLADGVDNLAHMGNLACKEAVPCFKQVSKAVKKCIKKNPDFVQDTIARAEELYRMRAQSQVEDFVNSRADTLFGEIAGLAMSNFGSVADIKNFVNQYVDADLKAQIQSDAEAAAGQIAALAKEFCGTGCVGETASFVKALFRDMDAVDTCVDARFFCVDCQSGANNYFNAGGDIPCCLDKLIQKGIEAYEYVADSYGAQVEEWAGLVSAELSEQANARAAEIRDEVLEQAGCIGDTYTAHKPTCA